MPDAVNTEGGSHSRVGKAWEALKAKIQRSPTNNSSTEVGKMEPKAEVKKEVRQFPPDSGYKNMIGKFNQEKKGLTDPTADQLAALEDHFIRLLEKPDLKLSQEERQSLYEGVKNGDSQILIKACNLLIKEYLQVKNIDEVRTRYEKSFGNKGSKVEPLELEAILADQLANTLRYQPKKESSRQKGSEYPPLSPKVVEALESINLDPKNPKSGSS